MPESLTQFKLKNFLPNCQKIILPFKTDSTETENIPKNIATVQRPLEENIFTFLKINNRVKNLAYLHFPYGKKIIQDADQEALLDDLLDFKGKIIIMGNNLRCYNQYLNNWRSTLVLDDCQRKRPLWFNFVAHEQLELV